MLERLLVISRRRAFRMALRCALSRVSLCSACQEEVAFREAQITGAKRLGAR